MPLIPDRVKYRKMHRGNRAGLATRGHTVAFGEYGLMALQRCWLDTKQIESARVAIARNMKRHGKMWIRVFPQKSYTKKPLETRMGKGKGPLPIRVSSGFLVYDFCGKTRIHILPWRFILRAMATRADSICLVSSQHRCKAINPYSPNATVWPRVARPARLPRCILRYLTISGIRGINKLSINYYAV